MYGFFLWWLYKRSFICLSKDFSKLEILPKQRNYREYSIFSNKLKLHLISKLPTKCCPSCSWILHILGNSAGKLDLRIHKSKKYKRKSFLRTRNCTIHVTKGHLLSLIHPGIQEMETRKTNSPWGQQTQIGIWHKVKHKRCSSLLMI